jgi:hypothetical protein
MPFQMPITIADVLRRIQTRDYVLPAIQREFVWDRDQIARLFDSLLRGYPIGSFLFWSVEADHAADYKFYGFIKDFHQRDNPHCPVLDLAGDKAIIAILDGQQRMTALNIGLRGTFAQHLPGRRRNNASAYPVTRLYLNLCRQAPENEQGMLYDLRFFAQPPPSDPTNGVHWFPVHRIMGADLGDTTALFDYAVDNGFSNDKAAFRLLNTLHKVVHDDKVINFYEENDHSLDKVLDIFIRVNSGGTVLSYSDLLLSIATAQWDTLDARDEIHGLVDELNGLGQGSQNFSFSKDVVLKAGLVLTEVSDIGFKVTNFNRANMARLQKQWPDIEMALRLAANLLADFGFSADSLAANSVLIPVAYYVCRRGLGDDYRLAGKFDADREQLRYWVVRTLVKPGVWGSGLDTLLRELHRVITEEGGAGFPTAALESAMATRGKALTFSDEEINDLVETPYGDKRAFALLALLFPHVDTRNRFHVDHVFPRTLFKRSKLLEAGVPLHLVDEYTQLVNRLPNLQLLEGQINVEKQAALPLDWAQKKYPEKDRLEHYLALQDLTGLPATLPGFGTFYETRKRRLADRLCRVLGVTATPPNPLSPRPEVPSALPPMGNGASTDKIDAIRTMLTRIAVPEGQKLVYQALYDAGDRSLTGAELARATGRTIQQLSGILGALGLRIHGTKQIDGRDGIDLVFEVREEPGGGWSYRLLPEARRALEEERLV